MTSFFFTSYNPNIFNCTVVGPKAQPCYTIVTDDQMPGYTVVRDMEGKNVSLIEWQRQPYIEIRGMVSKQAIGTWLRLSPNKEYVSWFILESLSLADELNLTCHHF